MIISSFLYKCRLLLFLVVVFSATSWMACNKSTSTPSQPEDTIQEGTIVTKGDSAIITVGKLIVTYSKTAPCYPSSEVFTFKATIPNLPNGATFHWYFGDGHIDTGTTTSHEYNNTAAYVVLIEVKTSSNILLQQATFPIKAWGQQLKPIAIFSTKQDFSSNINYITFNSASSVNHGSIINHHWDWADGTPATNTAQALTRHLFPTAPVDKTYPVKLTITTDAGCTADTTVNVVVLAKYPITGSFNTVSLNACTNETIVFTPAAANVPSGSEYWWHFSDGTGDLSGSTVSYQYAYMNDYDVIMYIKLNGREIYRINKLVNSKGRNPKPNASFYYTWKSQSANDVLISFNSNSTIKHGGIDGYKWDLGNGVTDNDYNAYVENTYLKTNAQANYTARLIVTGNGCADTAYQYLSIPAK